MSWISESDPEGDGEWSDLLDWPLIAIHSIVLPDGKVLSFGTDERGMESIGFVYDIYDPETGQHQTLANITGVDIFCSNMAIVPATGEVLIMGGDKRGSGGAVNEGIADATIFDYRTLELVDAPLGDMAYERWYGTVVTLASGDILIMGGRASNFDGSTIPEIYDPQTGFRELPGAEIADFQGVNPNLENDWWYPHAWQRSDGKVVVIEGYNEDIFIMDVTGEGAVEKVGVLPFDAHKVGPAVMFDVDKVLMAARDGGLWVGDLSGAVPSFERVAEMVSARSNGSFSLLADGTVLITGGGSGYDGGNELATAVYHAAIFDPSDNSVTQLADKDLARLYHHSALAMPDGTLLSIGGGSPGPLTNLNGQIFAPPMLFDETGAPAARPEILDAPSNIDSGATFTITVDDAEAVTSVSAIRSGAMTHARNTDTRYLSLDFTVIDGTTLEIATPSALLMGPGLWMVSTLDAAGTPSEAALIGVDMAPLEDTPPILGGPIVYNNEVQQFDGPVEISVTVRFDDLDAGPSQTVFEFGNGPEADSVTLHQIGDTADMAFDIWRDGTLHRVEAPGAIVQSETAEWTAQVLPDGTMRLSKNGALLAEGPGAVPADVARAEALFGSSSFEGAADLDGMVRDLDLRELVGQTGMVLTRQPGPDVWHEVRFDTPMDDPVVVMGPIGFAGGHPIHPRLKDVTSEGFFFQFEEWDYLDGIHGVERAYWMAVERGVHELGDGAVVEAGVAQVGHERADVALSGAFGGTAPVVLAQLASERGEHEAVHRVDAVGPEVFSLFVQEEEAGDGWHMEEDVNWIAFETGTHEGFTASADAGVGHRAVSIDLPGGAHEIFLADLQTADGLDPGSLRIRRKTDAEVSLFFQEERSLDHETWHTVETLGWIATDDLLFA